MAVSFPERNLETEVETEVGMETETEVEREVDVGVGAEVGNSDPFDESRSADDDSIRGRCRRGSGGGRSGTFWRSGDYLCFGGGEGCGVFWDGRVMVVCVRWLMVELGWVGF